MMSESYKELFNELSDTQLQFICKELNIAEEDLRSMSDDELDDVYDKICDIEVDETYEAGDDELSERGQLAEGIVTLWGNLLYAIDDDELDD